MHVLHVFLGLSDSSLHHTGQSLYSYSYIDVKAKKKIIEMRENKVSTDVDGMRQYGMRERGLEGEIIWTDHTKQKELNCAITYRADQSRVIETML